MNACRIARPKKVLFATSARPWSIDVAEAIAFNAGSVLSTTTTREIFVISSGPMEAPTRREISASAAGRSSSIHLAATTRSQTSGASSRRKRAKRLKGPFSSERVRANRPSPLTDDRPVGKHVHLNILLTSRQAEKDVKIIGFERLQALEFIVVFWKPRPLQGPAETGLQSQFDYVPAEVRRAVESTGTQQSLRIGQAGTCDGLEVGCAQHDKSLLPVLFVRSNSTVVRRTT